MKHTILLIALLIVKFCYAQDTKEVAGKILSSTVSIITKDKDFQTLALGSGFITDNEEVVTNLHVVEGARYVFVIKNKSVEEISSSGYISLDKENDIVLLKVPGLIGERLEIKQTTFPQIGEQIFVAGNPKGLTGTFSDGLVSGIRELENRKLIQISAPISPGSSGGPVVDKSSSLIGVSVGGISDGQNLNFAIPALYVKKLIENKSSLNQFNFSKSKVTGTPYEDIREGVVVQDITASFEEMWNDGLPRRLQSFSIKNNLSFPVKSIKLLFIVYNKQGIPTDSYEEDYLKYYGDPIRPHLAHRVKISAWGASVESIKESERWEIRVLDFEIVK